MNDNTSVSNDVTNNTSSERSRVAGCVKWFNNKAGYGFITISNGSQTEDVFVHHSAINVNEEQYRFLVQGEYVEFECLHVEEGPHQWQASNVTGPNSGRLMCETRRMVHSSRSTNEHKHRKPQLIRSNQHFMHFRENVVPQDDPKNNKYEWLLVRRYRNNPHKTRHYNSPRSQQRPRSKHSNCPQLETNV